MEKNPFFPNCSIISLEKKSFGLALDFTSEKKNEKKLFLISNYFWLNRSPNEMTRRDETNPKKGLDEVELSPFNVWPTWDQHKKGDRTRLNSCLPNLPTELSWLIIKRIELSVFQLHNINYTISILISSLLCQNGLIADLPFSKLLSQFVSAISAKKPSKIK